MENQGWISLHRKIQDNFLYFSEPFTKAQAWIDLILNANHVDGKFIVRGVVIEIKRGELGWSELTMASRWQWSRNKVRGFLKLLENEQQIEQLKVSRITSITKILNYENYQKGTTEGTTKGQQKDNRRYTNNNDNNDNNDNNILLVFSFWNEQKIITHKKLTDKIKAKIKAKLSDYSLEDIKQSIVNYKKILEGKEYFWSYKWTLEDFLQRGLEKFMSWEVCSQNYLTEKSKKPGVAFESYDSSLI